MSLLANYSANAILAKSRTMYGRRLTARNYSELLACHSVNEIAQYLKSRTAYADVFEGSTTTSMHRGQLEGLLKKRLFDQYASLCRYEMSIGQDFYRYFILRGEVDQILRCLMLLRTGRSESYLFTLPAFFNKQSSIDLYQLADVKTFADLLKALSGSPYRKLLEPFATQDLRQINILLVEAVFDRYLYNELDALAKRGFHGKRRQEILDFIHLQLDMSILVDMYRLKTLFHADETFIETFVITDMSRMSKLQLRSLMQAPTADEMLRRLRDTRYGRDFERFESQYIEQASDKIQYYHDLRQFRYSTNPSVVMLCYAVLAENEVNNIIHIIEGIRYQVPVDEIRKLLIGVEE